MKAFLKVIRFFLFLILIVGASAVSGYVAMKVVLGGGDIPVPSVSGKHIVDALEIMGQSDLGLGIRSQEFDPVVAKHNVIRQDPPAGRRGKRGRRVSLVYPQRGPKRRLVTMAEQNAMEGLNQRRIKWLSESDKVQQALAELQETLNLPELPDRIECYDISNTQGTNSVGSMVVFEGGRPKNAHYRRFRIKTVEGPNDYASMQEMLRRRFSRLSAIRQEEREAAAANEVEREPSLALRGPQGEQGPEPGGAAAAPRRGRRRRD